MTKTQTIANPTAGCICGKCSTALWDEHGNVDYGFEWSDERGEYVPRECPVAAERRNRSDGENAALEHEAQGQS